MARNVTFAQISGKYRKDEPNINKKKRCPSRLTDLSWILFLFFRFIHASDWRSSRAKRRQSSGRLFSFTVSVSAAAAASSTTSLGRHVSDAYAEVSVRTEKYHRRNPSLGLMKPTPCQPRNATWPADLASTIGFLVSTWLFHCRVHHSYVISVVLPSPMLRAETREFLRTNKNLYISFFGSIFFTLWTPWVNIDWRTVCSLSLSDAHFSIKAQKVPWLALSCSRKIDHWTMKSSIVLVVPLLAGLALAKPQAQVKNTPRFSLLSNLIEGNNFRVTGPSWRKSPTPLWAPFQTWWRLFYFLQCKTGTFFLSKI